MRYKSFAKLVIAMCFWGVIARLSFSQSLQQTLNDIDVGDRWSYNDWDSAKAAAAKSKKPILALFR
ncbi:MAG: hypothetical protein KDB27_22425 [Planctomycetales bacterium]|nr:hypothetical protein [Planctomycetales bacterium]